MVKEKWFDCVSFEEAKILVSKMKSQGLEPYVVCTKGKIEVWVTVSHYKNCSKGRD
jgi:hypothetical protein